MKKEIPFLDLKAQLPLVREEIMERFNDIIDNTAFVANKNVAAYEEAFAQYTGAKHCIAVSNGTTALAAILFAYGITAGDEVIVPVNTFIATAEAVSAMGATPVFVDMDPASYLIDVTKIEAAITPKTKMIMPVHLYGQTADMDPIMAIAEQHNLIVVEDACQAHGARYNGKMAGNIGHAAGFSNYPGKNLGAWGEGGAITTNDDELARTMRMYISHGSEIKYHHELVGMNYRMNEFQGAVLDVKTRYIEDWNNGRRKNAAYYLEHLADVPFLQLPAVIEGSEPVWHLFVVQLTDGSDREAFMSHLEEHGVHTGIHYPTSLHLTNAYSALPYSAGDFPASEAAQNNIVSLPMFAELTEEELEYVCNVIKEYNA